MKHFILLLSFLGACFASCISSGDQNTINALLTSAGSVVSLCPSATITITGSIIFTAANQEINTQGYPTGSTRATIVVTGSTQSNAITGNCGSCSGIKIRNIQVNGNRPALGVISTGSSGLIEIGGPTSGQMVDNIHSYEPRGWSALHIAEGSLNCASATITNNQIGPSGNPNGTWADGISMACTNSLVANNVITDATDGAIVIFGAHGTRVMNNTIIASTRVLLGAINMVDYAPYNGNFNGVVVSGNIINAQGVQIKVGMACGPYVWGDDIHDVNYGATITGNTLTGNYMAYGIAVAGVRNFTIQNNLSTAKYVGKYGNCPSPPNAPPMAFVYTPSNVTSSSLQSNFVKGRVHYQICIQPGAADTLTYEAGQIDLQQGQAITLANASLTMQGDGNLVLYSTVGSGAALWNSATSAACSGTNICQFVFNANGQLLIQAGTTTVYTFSSTVAPSADLTISDTAPYLSLDDGNGSYLWRTSYDFTSLTLYSGQYIRQVSGGATYFLTMTSTGNMNVYQNTLNTGTLLYTTGLTGKTCPTGGCDLTLQGDGNLVIYGTGGAYWASGTNGRTPAVQKLHFDAAQPYVRLFDSSNSIMWASSYTFTTAFGLSGTQYIYNSGLYLVLQSDSNLAVHSGSITGTTLWSTSVTGHTCAYATCHAGLQSDGNFVIYSDQGASWASNTAGVANIVAWRFNTNAPYIQILNSTNNVVWSSS